jgi:hypothetical protein
MPDAPTQLHVVRQKSGGFSESLVGLACSSKQLTLLESKLRSIGILSEAQTLLSYEDISPWGRGGAETYIADFRVEFCSGLSVGVRHVIAKAAVRWGMPPDIVIEEWLRRQSRLEEFGARTAQTFAASEGTLYQEFILFPYAEWFDRADSHAREKSLVELMNLASRVDAAGFTPVEFVDSVRTDGALLFVVDFGADLGGFQSGVHGGAAQALSREWIQRRRQKKEAE